MLAFLARRLLATLALLLVVSLLVFLMLRVAPDDPAALMAGDTATPEQVEQVRQTFGLDRPLPTQYFWWLAHLVLGELGQSYPEQTPVASAVGAHLAPTAALAALALVIAFVLALPLGVAAARRPGGRLDRALSGLSLLGLALPAFVLGYAAIWLFSTRLGWLPAKGYQRLAEGVAPWLRHLVLPALALAAMQFALMARIARAALRDALDADYVRTARALGMPERTVLLRHALANAAAPIAAAAGLGIGLLVGGIVAVEWVFEVPGLGHLAVDAALARDLPTLQGLLFFLALVSALAVLLIDLACAALDPRLRDAPMPQALPASAAPWLASTPRLEDAWPRVRDSRTVRFGAALLGLVVLVALTAPWLGTIDPALADPAGLELPPLAYGSVSTGEGEPMKLRFVMGSDSAGRDIYSRVVYGTRPALELGAAGAVLALGCGLGLGLVAGFVRRADRTVTRVLDALATMPALLVALALAVAWPGSSSALATALAIPAIPRVARLVRSLTLATRAEPYALAAVSLGTSAWRLLLRDVLPNLVAPLVVRAVAVAGWVIVAAAVLSYLGVGPASEAPSWGQVMAAGRAHFDARPAAVFFPAAFLVVTMLALGILGQGLDAALRSRPAVRA